MSEVAARRPSPSQAETRLLILGAGPFGLAMAAEAERLGVEHVLLGEPMSFWRAHMPAGMLLRSGCDWHLDPAEEATLERFLATRGQTPAQAEPLALDTYLDYAEWFRAQKRLEPLARRVERLDAADGGFEARLDDGALLRARNVLLATGFAPFAFVPDELAALVPTARSSHSRDLVRPADFAGRRVLVVGGRQSAFESAALLAEAGARAVHVCHRHDTPDFTASDWTWVGPLLARIAEDPAWLQAMAADERAELDARFWTEGRRRLEPWLGPRVHRPEIAIRPGTRLVRCEPGADALRIALDDGTDLEVDHVLYATGYRVDLARLPLLAQGNLLPRIACRDGFPVLDPTLQTSVPGLYVTSLPATRSFGLFFAFTAAVRTSAHIVGRAVVAR